MHMYIFHIYSILNFVYCNCLLCRELDANLIQDISPGAFRTQTKLKEL